MENIFEFILAIITLLSGAGWLTERRKRKAESEKQNLINVKCEIVKCECEIVKCEM